MSKGITGTGEGFDLPGRRLGGFSRQPPLSSLRQTALAAAENRAHLGSLLPSGPKRLGGDSTISDALSPIQAAAMAAERRLQDDIWCGSHCSEIAGDEESCADTLQDHLDLDQGGERSSIKDVSSRHAFGGTSLKRSHGQYKPESSFVDLTTPPVSRSSINEGAKSPKRSCKSNNLIPHQSSSSATSSAPMLNDDNQGVTAMWECQSCTLLNPVSASCINIISFKHFAYKGISYCLTYMFMFYIEFYALKHFDIYIDNVHACMLDPIFELYILILYGIWPTYIFHSDCS